MKKPAEKAPIAPRLLSPLGVAQYLGVCKAQVFKQGILLGIPYLRIGTRDYYDVTDVDKWIEDRKLHSGATLPCFGKR